MNTFLKLLLWLFPFRFARDYGDAWQSANEDMLRAAASQPFLSRVGLMARMAWDVAANAPVAHWEALRERVLGPVPALVRSGAGTREILQVWVGHVMPSEEEWDRLAMFLSMGMAGLVCLFVLMYGIGTYTLMELVQNRPSAQVEDTTWVRMGAVFALFLLGFMLKILWGQVRHRKGPLLLPLALMWVSFVATSLLSLLVIQPMVMSQTDQVFSGYEERKALLATRPETMDASQWSPEQRAWFDPATGHVREERKELWCATKQGAADAEFSTTLKASNETAVVAGLLAMGSYHQLVIDGCLPASSYFEKSRQLAEQLRLPPSYLIYTWMRLSALSGFYDKFASNHLLAWSNLNPNVNRACHVLASTPDMRERFPVAFQDADFTNRMCDAISEHYSDGRSSTLGEPVKPLASYPHAPPQWMLGAETKMRVRQTDEAKVLSESDLKIIERDVLAHYGRYPSL